MKREGSSKSIQKSRESTRNELSYSEDLASQRSNLCCLESRSKMFNNDGDDDILLNFSTSAAPANKKRPRPSAPRPQNGASVAPKTASAREVGPSTAPKAAAAAVAPAPRGEVSASKEIQKRIPTAESAPISKRRRVEPESTASKAQKNEAGEKRDAPLKPNGMPKGAPTTAGGHILSSLFTGVSIPRVSSFALASAPSQGPSNAPLDGPVTFSTLGLHPLLVQHLQGPKMNIGSAPTDIQRKALAHLLSPAGTSDFTLADTPLPESAQSKKRDVLLASQTGSGKTLAFLLPILHSLLPLSSLSFIDRSVAGTLAVILTPTRELARQIYEVLEKLVSLLLRIHNSDGEAGDADEGLRMARWIVPTLLCGGSTKNHEKTRLRKGSTIVVATPGRLLDHLQNTSSFEVGKLRWLVLDEADRLLEMGFKESLEGIVRAIDGRRRIAMEAAREAAAEREGKPHTGAKKGDEDQLDMMGVRWWAGGRRTILCSATIDENVQMLAGETLKDPLVIRGNGRREGDATTPAEATPSSKSATAAVSDGVEKFAAPSQLRQHYVLVPPKLRFVSLIALLRRALYPSKGEAKRNEANDKQAGRRVIVFMSCTDSVDFHWRGVGGMTMANAGLAGVEDGSDEQKAKTKEDEQVAQQCDLLPNCKLYRLHGNLTQAQRIASLRAFIGSNKKGSAPNSEEGSSAVLFCTSVASRGLDLPSVGTVIQLDAPTENGVEEYVHRIGRTARVGKQGKSWITLLPHEKPIIQKYQDSMFVEGGGESNTQPRIAEVDFRDVLLQGFGGAADEYENRATDVQLAIERWVLTSEDVSKTCAFHQSFCSLALCPRSPLPSQDQPTSRICALTRPTQRLKRASSVCETCIWVIWPKLSHYVRRLAQSKARCAQSACKTRRKRAPRVNARRRSLLLRLRKMRPATLMMKRQKARAPDERPPKKNCWLLPGNLAMAEARQALVLLWQRTGQQRSECTQLSDSLAKSPSRRVSWAPWARMSSRLARDTVA